MLQYAIVSKKSGFSTLDLTIEDDVPLTDVMPNWDQIIIQFDMSESNVISIDDFVSFDNHLPVAGTH